MFSRFDRAPCILKICAFLFLSTSALAQFTVVTGTVTDPNGVPYANGTVSAQLITAGVTPTLNGQSFSMTAGPTPLSSAGSFVMQLVSNAAMVPATLKWKFTVCSATGSIQPAGGTGPQCFTASITISGATQSVSATLSAAAPALSITGGIASGLSGGGNTVVLSAGGGIVMTCNATGGCTITDGSGDTLFIG